MLRSWERTSNFAMGRVWGLVPVKPQQLEVDVWYLDRLGKRWRVIDFLGTRVRYEDQRGSVGDMDIKKFASKCVMKA